MRTGPYSIKTVLLSLHVFQESGARAAPLLSWLREKDLKIGLLTRLSGAPLSEALARLGTPLESFDASFRPKEGVITEAVRKLGATPAETMLLSPDPDEIAAGIREGAVTVWLSPDPAPHPAADFTVSTVEEAQAVIRSGVSLPAGKLPNDLLAEFLGTAAFDPSVISRPGVGEDTAAVKMEENEILVLKSDPITFAADSISRYAVLVNANDIATSGAVPRWFLATLLFPCGTTPSRIRHVMDELRSVCEEYRITLCGGHTEITDAVVRPVVTGMLAGTVRAGCLIEKRNMRTGHHLLLTKEIAVEGTAIISREFGEKLSKLGMSDAEIASCRDLLSRIDVLKEAKIAADIGGVSAMHDVTEGGLATAVEELSVAGGHRIRIHMDRIPILPETQRVSTLLGLRPLGLIGSGSLLICCSPSTSSRIRDAIRSSGIPAARIGEVLGKGSGIEAVGPDGPAEWPRFETDEITRLFRS